MPQAAINIENAPELARILTDDEMPAVDAVSALTKAGFVTFSNGEVIVTLMHPTNTVEVEGVTMPETFGLPLNALVGLTGSQVERLARRLDPLAETRAKVRGLLKEGTTAEQLRALLAEMETTEPREPAQETTGDGNPENPPSDNPPPDNPPTDTQPTGSRRNARAQSSAPQPEQSQQTES